MALYQYALAITCILSTYYLTMCFLMDNVAFHRDYRLDSYLHFKLCTYFLVGILLSTYNNCIKCLQIQF